MKRFQSLLASFVLVFALAAPAAAGDGIIHTGNPAVSEPSPTPSGLSDGGSVEGHMVEDGTGGGETTTLDLVVEAALDFLHVTLTLF